MDVASGLFVVAFVVAVLAVAAGLRLPAGLRRAAATGLGVAAACLAGAGAVFAAVAGEEALDAADAPVLAWAITERDPVRTGAAEAVSLVGGTVVTGGLAVVTAVVLLARGRRAAALVWVVAVAAGSLTIRLLKVAAERPRPPVATRLAVETSASLPSGHSLMAALGLGLVASAVVAFGRGRLRWVAVVLAALAVLAIGASRVYLGVHWSTDVLAGWLLGSALAALATTIAVVAERRRRPLGAVRRPDAAPTGARRADRPPDSPE